MEIGAAGADPVASVDARVLAVLREHGASFAYLHGSRARGDAREDSDVDVAAWWPADPPASFDVLLPPGVDLLVLNFAPLVLRGRVAVEGRLLFETDAAERVHWEATTRTVYFDELPRIRRADAEFAEGCGVVDETRVLRLLRSVTDDVAQLEREAGADEARRHDPMWLRGVKYTFVTAIEACVDAAQHVCSSEGWGPPADDGDAVRLLAVHGAVPAAVADAVRRAVGFRDVLVHDYAVVDDGVVLARLADVSDLRTFVRSLTDWLPRSR
ncbi:HepT-like ribonuclease domain-containing protein [Pseudokineococcus basanitobsidens]|uniref:HepT-like ribonuclease domain-containing protein n=1 Tax=Pseudokineococcus basanitobsidens TaxID=1926649 RepID=A0ABU8RP54_9ACTN